MGHDIDSEEKAIDRHSAHQGAFIMPYEQREAPAAGTMPARTERHPQRWV